MLSYINRIPYLGNVDIGHDITEVLSFTAMINPSRILIFELEFIMRGQEYDTMGGTVILQYSLLSIMTLSILLRDISYRTREFGHEAHTTESVKEALIKFLVLMNLNVFQSMTVSDTVPFSSK